ncbi:MAG: hypothetical protein A2527_06585 [Candidatus Lambdaproteobacteria bacterium RIFOXYD2_FULL_50_16]|uniref:Uncharacterized protein n=1 Tax=Candidatus Lambdaproteobacteria bacterium RIFOXYD2_FULL_50_16 TaxID=1817772 RepID=A0A1F6GA72_9PROT|nr:MAG: hypothetical protein A2527_06585 [Candidatus Lambdaproteobacteria bacterium RIFOXYD2_FULL_50_16]
MQIKGYAQNLAEYMVKLSNKYYSDRWMVQLEYELWRDLVDEPEILEAAEVKKLREIAETAGGWVLMDYQTNELEFMNTGRWLEHYKKNKPF